MRDDGRIPIENRRGARAVCYHGRTISAMVQIAERTRVQCIDLYGEPSWGTGSIHHAVAFFINAVITPTIVLPCAKTTNVPGPAKDYTRQHLGGRGTLGWSAPYMTGFSIHFFRAVSINDAARRLTDSVSLRRVIVLSTSSSCRCTQVMSELNAPVAACVNGNPDCLNNKIDIT